MRPASTLSFAIVLPAFVFAFSEARADQEDNAGCELAAEKNSGKVRFHRVKGEAAWISSDLGTPAGTGDRTLRFLEAANRAPYSVTETITGVTCSAPCEVRVPAGAAMTVLTFDTPLRTFRESYRIADEDLSLQLRQGGSTNRLVGGGVLLGLGIPGLIAAGFFGFAYATMGTDDGGQNDWKYHVAGYTLMIGGGLINLAAIALGSWLVHTGRGRVARVAVTEAAGKSGLSTLRLAVVPTDKGFGAGASFRF